MKKAYFFRAFVAVSLIIICVFSVRERPEWMLLQDLLVIAAVPFGIKGKNKTISTLLAYSIIRLSYIQSLLMYALENSGWRLFVNRHTEWGFLEFYMNEAFSSNFILVALVTLISGVCVVILLNVLKKKPPFDFMMFDLKGYDRRLLILLQSAIIGLAIIASVVQARFTDGSSGTIIEQMATLLLCGSVTTIVALISKSLTEQSEKNSYKELAFINEMLVEKQKEYYDLLLKREEETKKFRHDINYHFSCFKYFLENELYGDAKKYIDEVINHSAGLKPVLETGNSILNVVVSDLLNRFSENRLRINWKGLFPAETKISPADLCVIFSNALTNAVEAIYKLKSSVVETIDVTVKSIRGHLFVSIVNPSAAPVHIGGKFLKTDKQDKSSHGFGMQIIVERVEKNGGTVKFINNGTSFCVEMTFGGVVS